MASLCVQPVTLNDIPTLTQLWYRAFSIPINLRMFPNTPGVRVWWDETNCRDLLHNPLRKLFKVVDPARPEVVIAYAKWDLDPSESGERFLPWHEESDRETCERLFDGLDEERRRFLGDRKHYCMIDTSRKKRTIELTAFNLDLDTLLTHPEYRRQGAASLLIQWGCDLADQNGVAAYLDAHVDAAPLYRKFGFKDRDDIGVTSDGALPMIREPQRRD